MVWTVCANLKNKNKCYTIARCCRKLFIKWATQYSSGTNRRMVSMWTDCHSILAFVRVHVCVCVHEFDLVSVGVVDVFRGQWWDHGRLSLALDVHRQQHWLQRERGREMKCLLYADDLVILSPLEQWLQRKLSSLDSCCMGIINKHGQGKSNAVSKNET